MLFSICQSRFIFASSLVCISSVWTFGVHAEEILSPSLVQQAIAHEHGEGVPKDLSRAMALYCQAAKQGDPEAQFGLAWMFANGRGVEHNDAIAATLFEMAAKQDHKYAANMLHFVGVPTGDVPECLKPDPVEEASVISELDTPARHHIVQLVKELAPQYNVEPGLALAVIAAESGFQLQARSSKNAQGLMQLIPETSLRFNVRDPYDPVQNIRGGLAYLRWLLAYFRGNVALVAAGYNAGEGAVNRYRGIPPYRETQGYVKRILNLFKRKIHPYDENITGPSPELDRIRVNLNG